jgi:hypothetical protein|tara:strand:- start:1600 stop:3429 length:1830 start_codon:yes stop_codon:yes gene_type:complete
MAKRSRKTSQHRVAKELSAAQVEAKFQHALACHQQGNLAEAQSAYQEILQSHPKNFDALHLLGVIASQTNNHARAVELIGDAIEVIPDNAMAHYNRGFAYQELGQLESSIASYDRAIAANPNYGQAYSNRGAALQELKQWNAAVADYDRAILIDPADADAYSNRGFALKEQNRLEEAVASCDKAIEIKPDHAVAYYNRGNALRLLKHLDAAIESYSRSAAIKPDYAEALTNRGVALRDLRRLNESVESFNEAIAANPDYAEAHSNRGISLQQLKQLDAAVENYDRSIAIRPDYAEAHFNKSLALLSRGDFVNGWKLYEWRWRKEGFGSEPLATTRPRWDTGDENQRLLIWAEQGLGDEIMFGKLLSRARQISSELLVQIDSRLIPLFERSMPEIAFLSKESGVDESSYERHMPMGSLPMYLCRSDDEFKTIESGYLSADKERAAGIRRQFASDDVKLCGISWRSKNEKSGSDRSLELKDFVGTLDKTNGLRLVNLQYGNTEQEIAEVKETSGVDVLCCDEVDNFYDIDGLASMIDACDLVISIDNSTAHLAGALGKPTWVLLPFSSEWRWLHDRDDSLWYSSLKLYRQPNSGDWSSVLARIGTDLARIR